MRLPYDLCNIQRNIEIRPNYKRVYLITEGTRTEPNFLKDLLKHSDYFKDRNDLQFTYIRRSGNDFGKNRLSQMVDCAKEEMKKRKKYINDSIFIIFFDLDIYINNLDEVENIIKENQNIYFAYTSPAFELFLLLCNENAYEKYIKPNETLIFENNRDESSNKRYVHQLLQNVTGVDSKKGDLSRFASSLKNAIEEENHISHSLKDAGKMLVSNVGLILRLLRDDLLHEVTY